MLDEISWKLTLPFQLSQIVPTLTDCENRTGNEMAETQNASLRHITMERQCLTMHPPPAVKITAEKTKKRDRQHVEVLHLFRCYTHT